MKKRHIIITFIIIILFFNFTPLSYILSEDFSYSSYNGDFRSTEMKGGDYTKLEEGFNNYKKKFHPRDTTIYRTYTIKPWRFWQWKQFVFFPSKLMRPYISEEQIKENKLNDQKTGLK